MPINDLSNVLSLDGEWEFALGEGAEWGRICVPGCWEAQGYPKQLDGPARYRKAIQIPAEWLGQRVCAEFEGVSYACHVRLNGQAVGEHQGMWTLFSVDLTPAIRPGEQNLLELEVYKPGSHYPVRSSLAGFLYDVATTFGGIWQPVRLRAFRPGLEAVRVDADLDSGALWVHAHADLPGPITSRLVWQVEVYRQGVKIDSAHLPFEPDGEMEAVLPVSRPALWSPENPILYSVRISLLSNGNPIARVSQRAGFRRLSHDGGQLLLNGQPFMVRGLLSWGWQPDVISPYYTKDQARQELRRLRSLGFNLVKLCLFVPNPAYLEAADEEGMLLWEEFPLWLPEMTPELRARMPSEYASIADLIRTHPSVALVSLGCELGRSVDGELIDQLDQAVRSQVQGVLMCENSGSGESYGGLDEDRADFSDYHPYYDLAYFEPLLDHWRRDWKRERPWIFGEFCDADTFRDLNEIYQANGGTPPWWATMDNPVREWRPEGRALVEELERLERAGLNLPPAELVRISYAKALTVRKYALEALRRRESMGGYVLTGLRDTPISTSGIWDDLDRPKWTPEQFLPINGETVLCLDTDRRRRWTYGGDRPGRLDPHNFWSGESARWHVILSTTGPSFPSGSRLSWSLSGEQDETVAQGELVLSQEISPGRPREAGLIACRLPEVSTATQLRLEGGNAQVANTWPVWVYPSTYRPSGGWAVVDPAGAFDAFGGPLDSLPRLLSGQVLSHYKFILSTTWDEALANFVSRGGRLLLLQQGSGPLPALRCPFWREAIQIFPDHPIWQTFPQQGYPDLQFFGLASDVAFDLSRWGAVLPGLKEIRPLLRRLDARQFHMSEYLVEANLGQGCLLACSLRLQGGLGAQPQGYAHNPAGGYLLGVLMGEIERMKDEG